MNVKIKILRSSVTKTITTLNAACNQIPLNYVNIRALYDTLTDKSARLESHNTEFTDSLELDNTDEATLAIEFERMEDYRTNTTMSLSSASHVLELNKITAPARCVSAKLPKITLPFFDGNILKWFDFIESFDANVDNADLSDVNKFTY